MVFCIPSKGQVPDTIRISHSDSVQIELLKKVPDDVIHLEILKIQGQIIDNLNYMMDYMYQKQKKIEIKLDSVLNVMQNENKNSLKKKKKKEKN
jgi:gamma-glutamylcyclotransferase (GGCT)/AIG2-like uncharacterized protein YtfP